MTLRKLRQLAAGIAAITAPLTASAQDGGTVIVAPFAAGAPALGWPALGVLAIALAAGAMLMLRRAGQPGTRLLGVVAVLLTAAVGHGAANNVIISGDECHQRTQESYPPLKNVDLQNECPNPIRIIDLQITCSSMDEVPAEAAPDPLCEVGLVVPPGGVCRLPACPC